MTSSHIKAFAIASVFLFSDLRTYCQQAVTGYDVQVDSIYYQLKGDSAIVVYDNSFIGGTGRNPSYSSRTSIFIPDVICANNKTYKVKAIGARAFFNCQVLKTISIPSCITAIGTNAFQGCSVLDSVVSYIKNPIAIDESVFFKSGSYIHNVGAPNGMPSNAILYVPSGTKTLYENTEGWNQFESVVEMLSTADDTFTALTEEDVEMEYRVISASEKTCEVSRLKDYRTEGEITIPSEVNSFQVTAIGESAFVKCSNITTVKVPNTIIKIGSLAFAGCSNLSAIKLPNSITTIGYGAFEGCENLKSIVIPSSVTIIECLSPTGSWGNPFQFCSSLERIVVESGNTVYDSRENCNAIIKKSYDNPALPTGITTLITGCKNTVIPSSVQAIGDYAFAGMGMTHIDIPSSVGDNIGANAFYGNYVEKNEFITHGGLDPANCNYWGCTILDTSTDDGFYISNGKLLKYTGNDSIIVIPEIVTSISDYVFSGRADITSVTIPDKVMSIGYGAFLNCSSLKSVNIPSGVTIVNDNTFNGCMALSSIDLPKNIRSIGDFAFSGCSSLETIIFHESLNSIGSNAFQGCKSLTEVYCYKPVCPETGNDVFLDSNISNATLWVLETSYEVYKATAPWSDFGNIKKLEVAIVNPSKFTFMATTAEGVQMRFRITDSATMSAEVYGYYESRTATIKEYFPAISREVTKATIPSSVYTNQGEYNITGISSNAFYGCKINTLSIPSSISTIRYDAFENCTNLTKVIIPDIASWCSVKFILYNNNNFYRNDSPFHYGHLYSDEYTEITNLIIPDGVTAINDYVFAECDNLISIQFPKTVKSIGKGAFYGCNSLKKVVIPDIGAWCSVSFASFSDNPISQCHYLCCDDNTDITELRIPEGVTHIVPHAFYGCWNIKKFIIPDGLLSIGEDAFPFPKSTMGTTENWFNLYYYCNTGTAGLLAVWNYLSQLSKSYDQKVINLQNAYDAKDRKTKLPPPSLSVKTTQTTATISISGFYNDYDYTLNNKTLDKDELLVTGLYPDYNKNLTLKVSLPNISNSYICYATLATSSVSPSVLIKEKTASSISFGGGYCAGEAHVTKQTFMFNDEIVKSKKMYGLEPNTSYKISYTIEVSYGDELQYTRNYTDTKIITTSALILTTQQPKVISAGNVIVGAESNLDDEETQVGFEWRRTDWTDDFVSNTGGAYLYEGKMEGYIRNMYTEKLWKFRPYYESDSGNRYYGEWVGIDPTNTSYFEPTVHTYAIISVESNTAEVKGYAMRGTDNIIKQGFMYWEASSQHSPKAKEKRVPDVPANAEMVEANGNLMNATLENLDYDTEYCYVAFVTTSENETFYGEEQTFKTGTASQEVIDGIEGPDNVQSSMLNVQSIYDINGRKLSAPQKGMNIIRMSDGTTRKVLVR